MEEINIRGSGTQNPIFQKTFAILVGWGGLVGVGGGGGGGG